MARNCPPPFFFHVLLSLLPLLVLPTASVAAVTGKGATFASLTGSPPLIIARGGASNLFPDMTSYAYNQAVTDGADYLSCTVLMTNDSQLVCRPGPDLGNNTGIHSGNRYHKRFHTYEIEGKNQSGFFTSDFTLREIRRERAIQPNSVSRPPAFDLQLKIRTPQDLVQIVKDSPRPIGLYFDLFSPAYFASQGLNLTSAFLSFLQNVTSVANGTRALPIYVASSDVSALLFMRNRTSAHLLFKLYGSNSTDSTALEPSTGRPFVSFLQPLQLPKLKKLVDGILIPKTFLYPHIVPGVFGDGREVGNATRVVEDAHKAGLLVHGYDFANDDPKFGWNWNGDPVNEMLAHLVDPTVGGFDAVLTDNPATAAVSIGCFPALGSPDGLTELPTNRPLIIGESSGYLPAQTAEAFIAGIQEGADVIQCLVQMTRDGIPICRESPDLAVSTDVLFYYPSTPTTLEPLIQSNPGVFTFDQDSSFILNNISAVQSSPFRPPLSGFGVISLAQFFAVATQFQRPLGLVLDLQYPTFYASRNLSVASAVLDIYTQAKAYLKPSDVVWIQSLEAGVLTNISKLQKGGASSSSNSTGSSRSSLAAQSTAAELKALKLVQRIDNLTPRDPSTGKAYAYYASAAGLKEIAAYAQVVSVYKRFIVRISSSNASDPAAFFLSNMTSLSHDAHAQGLGVWAYDFADEPITLEYDYQQDPFVKANLFATDVKADGIVTSFPATIANYLYGQCWSSASPKRNTTNSTSSVIPAIVPGAFLSLIQDRQALPAEQSPSPSPSPALGPPSPSPSPSPLSPTPANSNSTSPSPAVGPSPPPLSPSPLSPTPANSNSSSPNTGNSTPPTASNQTSVSPPPPSPSKAGSAVHPFRNAVFRAALLFISAIFLLG